MSLPHAPCGDAPGVDPAYPYADASTGVWGYDFRDGGSLVSPSRYRDLMSYCDPEWVSDYNFDKALRFRLADEGGSAVAAVAAPAASLLLWGGVDADGDPFLEPAFVVDAPPALPQSGGEYRVTGRTASGGELFSLSFGMPEGADGDDSSSFAWAVPVRAAWAGELATITRWLRDAGRRQRPPDGHPAQSGNGTATITLSGPGGSVTLDGDSDRPMAILRNPETGQVRGFLSDLPPATQAARDAAGRAAGPELEVLFSRGIPGASAWRR